MRALTKSEQSDSEICCAGGVARGHSQRYDKTEMMRYAAGLIFLLAACANSGWKDLADRAIADCHADVDDYLLSPASASYTETQAAGRGWRYQQGRLAADTVVQGDSIFVAGLIDSDDRAGVKRRSDYVCWFLVSDDGLKPLEGFVHWTSRRLHCGGLMPLSSGEAPSCCWLEMTRGGLGRRSGQCLVGAESWEGRTGLTPC